MSRQFNIQFPLVDDDELNSLFSSNLITRDGLVSNLILLLVTEKGSRWYNPDYGTNLTKYIFEPNDSKTISDIEREVKETVSKYLSELKIVKVSRIDNPTNDDFETPEGGYTTFNLNENESTLVKKSGEIYKYSGTEVLSTDSRGRALSDHQLNIVVTFTYDYDEEYNNVILSF